MSLKIECVTPEKFFDKREFCLTDCGPSEGCNPDDRFRPEECKTEK